MKVGDTLRLKSGGPLMTVTLINEGPRTMVHCVWFDERWTAIAFHAFPIDCLTEPLDPRIENDEFEDPISEDPFFEDADPSVHYINNPPRMTGAGKG